MSLKEQSGWRSELEGDFLETQLGPRSAGSQKEASSVSRGLVGGAAGRGGGNSNSPSPEHSRVLKELMHDFIGFPKGPFVVCDTKTLTRSQGHIRAWQRHEMGWLVRRGYLNPPFQPLQDFPSHCRMLLKTDVSLVEGISFKWHLEV